MKQKSHTDIEQSRKLAEILPLESADMCWIDRPQIVTDCPEVPVIPNIELEAMLPQNKLLSCWSLSALRNLLPPAIKPNKDLYLFESHNTFDNSWVYRYYNEDDTSYLYCKNTSEINACVEMIIKLHELNLL